MEGAAIGPRHWEWSESEVPVLEGEELVSRIRVSSLHPELSKRGS